MKKYRLLDNDTKVFFGRTLFRIQALNSFGDVQEGDLGGDIEKEKNLNIRFRGSENQRIINLKTGEIEE